MRHTLTGPLPRHLYCWVDTRHTHKEPVGFAPAVWYGLVSYPGRLWGCTVMLESGAIYRNIPAHAISFSPTPRGVWRPQDAQTWDCYGEDFSTLEYGYLQGLKCRAKSGRTERSGKYLFTVAPVGDGFSAYPEQAKEFMFIQLDNGWMTVQPTDRVVFRERSFTDNKLTFPRGFKRQTTVWTCE